MKVYIVIQDWQSDYDSGHDIKGVFDSFDKASAKVAELYQDDCEWLQEEGAVEFDDNVLEPSYSNVVWEECWSTNSVETHEIQ